jgi:hypothetical protein
MSPVSPDEISQYRLTKSASFAYRNQPVSPDEISRFRLSKSAGFA